MLVRQLLNGVHLTFGRLLRRYRLLCADFGEVGLVRRLQTLSGLVVLLPDYFLRCQGGIQILNVLLIAGVLFGIRQ